MVKLDYLCGSHVFRVQKEGSISDNGTTVLLGSLVTKESPVQSIREAHPSRASEGWLLLRSQARRLRARLRLSEPV